MIMEIVNNSPKSDCLYHYTTKETLCCMLNNYRNNMSTGNLIFWASSIFSMNDPKEMRFGKEVLEILLPFFENLFNLSSENRLDINSLDTEKILNDITHIPFVLSFSKCEDDLSMWTMYGDEGRGIAMIFDKDIVPYPMTGICNPELIEVNYQKGVKDYPKLRQIYNSGIQEWTKCCEDEKIKESKERTLSKLFVELCPYIKSETYHKEKEYRFCFCDVPRDKIMFRTRNKQILPYIEVPIPISHLRGIILGPCSDFKMTTQTLRVLLKCCALERVKVFESTIPYRKM